MNQLIGCNIVIKIKQPNNTMKKIEMIFYKTDPSPSNTGLKYVLWQITDTSGANAYDWGFAMWDGSEWEEIEVPQGYTATVHSWANTVNPSLLLKEPSKIVRL